MGLISDQVESYKKDFVSLETLINELSIVEHLPHTQVAGWLLRKLESDPETSPKILRRNPVSLQVYELNKLPGGRFAPVEEAANYWPIGVWDEPKYSPKEHGFWRYQIERFLITVDANSDEPGTLVLPPCLGGEPFPKPPVLMADDESESEFSEHEDSASVLFDTCPDRQALEAERDQARQALADAEARAAAAERERDELRERLEVLEAQAPQSTPNARAAAQESRHANNRAGTLSAALCLLAEGADRFRDGSGRVVAVRLAEAIADQAHRWWIDGTPPLSNKTMTEHLAKALSRSRVIGNDTRVIGADSPE